MSGRVALAHLLLEREKLRERATYHLVSAPARCGPLAAVGAITSSHAFTDPGALYRDAGNRRARCHCNMLLGDHCDLTLEMKR